MFGNNLEASDYNPAKLFSKFNNNKLVKWSSGAVFGGLGAFASGLAFPQITFFAAVVGFFNNKWQSAARLIDEKQETNISVARGLDILERMKDQQEAIIQQLRDDRRTQIDSNRRLSEAHGALASARHHQAEAARDLNACQAGLEDLHGKVRQVQAQVDHVGAAVSGLHESVLQDQRVFRAFSQRYNFKIAQLSCLIIHQNQKTYSILAQMDALKRQLAQNGQQLEIVERGAAKTNSESANLVREIYNLEVQLQKSLAGSSSGPAIKPGRSLVQQLYMNPLFDTSSANLGLVRPPA